ncbi:hypothetical protein [Petrachloros mirabilis]
MNRTLIAVMTLLGTACGVVGSPVPPETVGVSRTIEEQKKRDAQEATQRETAEMNDQEEPEGQEVILPSLRPVGTR